MDIAALAQRSFPEGYQVATSIFVATADVHEHELAGRTGEFRRVRVNGEAFLQELHAANTGWLRQQGFTVGRDAVASELFPIRPFKKVYLIQRTNSAGRDARCARPCSTRWACTRAIRPARLWAAGSKRAT